MKSTVCYHCGDTCNDLIQVEGKSFCCNGCKQVYLLLENNHLCQYYDLTQHPGISAKGKWTDGRFGYLDDASVVEALALFKDESQVNIEFSLPQIHCTSCVFLLEKLHQIEPGILRSRVHFEKKKLFVSYHPVHISLSKVVELLAFVGYEPEIHVQDAMNGPAKKPSRKKELIQMGVAGFCFSNIMMLSFPEYFSGGYIETAHLKLIFSTLIFLLSIPVLFYSARGIFHSAWTGLRMKQVNMDAPIALASIITFSRSYYEILSGTGAGYLDSGTGIIFFMLIGRWFQHKTYDSLSFDRKYQSFFPLGVTVRRDEEDVCIPVQKLQIGEKVITRCNEIIPADSILLSEWADIDYSFVNGENSTSRKKAGDLIYAGGRQTGGAIESRVIKLPSQSYITELWNNSIFSKHKSTEESFVHPWSRYFTMALFSIATIAGIYWYNHDASKLFPVVTAVLIVACPCSLLLTSTFTFGNMQRVLGSQKIFLKNATVLESLSRITDIVFDKTGTLTEQSNTTMYYHGAPLNENEKMYIKTAAAQSAHVLSRAVHDQIVISSEAQKNDVDRYHESQGAGMVAAIGEDVIMLGSGKHTGADSPVHSNPGASEVHVKLNNTYKGFFEIKQPYRKGLKNWIDAVKKKFHIHVLSGDRSQAASEMESLLGKNIPMQFEVTPQQKLDYIKKLQSAQKNVMMIGDGLNDAGALMQAQVGMAVSDQTAHFTPACDIVIDGEALPKLPTVLRYARATKKLVGIGFVVSILYNIVGLSFAVQGKLVPVVAAILMPLSSISLVTLAIVLTSTYARIIHLKTPSA